MSNQRDELFLPYAGTSGHSGSETSAVRARTMDKSGKTAQLQNSVLAIINHAEADGVTWKDISERLNVHHGTASGVLSVLHLSGKIERLSATRDRCKIYVSPDWVFFRPTETPKNKQPKTKSIATSVFQVLGKEVLVTQYPDGSTTVAVRDYPSDTWSAPIAASYTQKTIV
jgi:hypothetical protein